MNRILNLLVLAFLLTHSGYAQQLHTVTNLNDSGPGSFRQLVDDAVDGDTIRFSTNLLNSGSDSIVLASQISIDQNVTIIGLYNQNDTLYISGNQSNRLFLISGGLSLVTMDSLVLINGRITDANGGAILSSSPLTMIHCILNDNSSFVSATTALPSSSCGGAVYTSSALTLSFCTLNGNSSTITTADTYNKSSKGGAIYAEGFLTMNSCTINDNTSISSNTLSTVSGSTQYSYNANSNGGAIYAVSGLSMNNCSLSNNSASASTHSSYLFGSTKGGAIYSESSLTMNLCVLNGNSSLTSSNSSNFAPSSLGGAIYAASTLTMDSCVLDGNSSTCPTSYVAHSKGGAVYAVSMLTMTTCTLTDNAAAAVSSYVGSGYYFANTSSGGAVYSENGMTLIHCTVDNNSSTSSSASFNPNSSSISKGGAIYASNLLTIDSCTINNNLSKNLVTCTDPFCYGGAIYAANGLVMSASVLNGNSANSLPNTSNAFASSYGGAIYVLGGLTINQCSLTGNSCPARISRGGAIFSYGAVTMGSCSLSSNSASSYYSSYGGAMYINGRLKMKASTLINNFSSSTYTSSNSYGGAIYQGGGITMSTCILRNNSCSSPAAAYGGAIYSLDALMISNCELSNNYSSSYKFNSSSRGGAIYSEDTLTAGSCTITDNFTYSPASKGDAIWVDDNNITLYNSIVASTINRPQIPIQNTAATIPTVLVSYNSYVSKIDLSASNDNFDGTDPTINLRFVDTAGNDFRLAPNSVLVNSGANNLLQNDTLDVNNNGNTSEQLPVDLQGTTRIMYGRVDLGAYEASSVGIDTIVCEVYISPSGLTKTVSEVFNDTIPSINGSDSILTIYLLVGSPTASTIDTTVCETFTSPSGNHTWISSGTYMDTIPNFYGCDSVMTINLILNTATMSTIDTTVCGTYTSPSENHTWTSSGTYMDTIPNAIGCDSIITIHLIVNTATMSTMNVSTCGIYTSPGGNHTWTSSGTYMDTIPNALGCDSIITINLIVGTATTSTIDTTVCGTYTSPGGNNTWTSSGTYMDTIPNATGCDSVITILLTVNPMVDATTTLNADLSIRANISNAVYQWIDCADNTFINNANGQTFVPLENGSYAVIVTNQEGCSETSDCVEIESLGLEYLLSNQIKLYPNPCTDGKLTIESTIPILEMTVSDINGTLLAPPVNVMTGTIDVSSLATGHYFVRLITPQGIVNKLFSVIR